ncbi:MAG: hypothetical protein M3295_05715 [Chloroflexota bacterium]|nr:hypothetical protein [Chloroflexota bacterium]
MTEADGDPVGTGEAVVVDDDPAGADWQAAAIVAAHARTTTRRVDARMRIIGR